METIIVVAIVAVAAIFLAWSTIRSNRSGDSPTSCCGMDCFDCDFTEEERAEAAEMLESGAVESDDSKSHVVD